VDARLSLGTAPGGLSVGRTLHEATPNSMGWPIVAIAFTLLLQAYLVFTRAINWDEFFYYFETYRFASNGDLARALQTWHVRLFGWIVGTGGSGTSIDRILLARCIMYGCELVSLAAIAGIAAKFTDRTIGLLCALGYLAAGFVFQHGFSFRADPMLAACLMGALWILCCSRLQLGSNLLFGALVATAGMLSIKSALFAPAFAGIAWYRWNEDARSIGSALRMIGATILASVLFGLLYLYHSQDVATPIAQAGSAAPSVSAASQDMVAESARKMFSFAVQPYWQDIPRAMTNSLPLALLVLMTPQALLRRDVPRHRRLALFGLFLPITLLAFYHNTAPYFYAFMLAPVAVACCLAMVSLRNRYSVRLISLVLAFNAFAVWALDGPSRIGNQRQIVKVAHQVFKQPVGYFDFCYMLTDFRKANGFMTLWGVDQYFATGRSLYRERLMRQQVPLLLEDDPMYTRLLREETNHNQSTQADFDTLRATYVHFWGPFWIAGQDLTAGEAPREAELLVPGIYTARGGAITVDGQALEKDATIKLERGTHRLAAVSGDARLVWGNRLEVPDEPEPGPMWTYF